MSISDFIADKVLIPRLKQRGCLVVYDPDRRYHELCLALASDTIRVIDAGISSIESRAAALAALGELGSPQSPLEGLLVYVPASNPVTDEQRQADPFALYAACGALFPSDDGDEYIHLCLRARPDFATEIRRIFNTNPSPPFAVIDAVGGGMNWPQLRALLKVDSARGILAALFTPTEAQLAILKEQTAWNEEARDLLRVTLGLDLKTRSKTWPPLAEELWRFLLFSEFAFDQPGHLPTALAGVPRAPVESLQLIDDICADLRNDLRSRDAYIDRAEAIEAELGLPTHCEALEDLGAKATFPFEERSFLRRAVQSALADDIDTARSIVVRYSASVWLGRGESQAQWACVQAALDLCSACHDFDLQLADHARTQQSLLDFYTGGLREVDRLQREFEQAVTDFVAPDPHLSDLTAYARARYRKLSEKVQTLFLRHLETSGWPPPGRLANADVFDRFVAPQLKERGNKVAYIMVDALRYELGVALEKRIADAGPVELHTAHAQLPSITLVGMASLLPGAAADLTLDRDGDTLKPAVDGVTVANASQRMEFLRKRYGDRFHELLLGDFIRNKVKLAPTVDLLVIRSREIDNHLESSPETAIGLIPATLTHLRAALHKLRGLGFHCAVIATDHGFFLNTHAEPGDVCQKPQGTWPVNAHDRLLLGDGPSDGHNLVLPAAHLGIRGAFARAALPRSMAPYRAGYLYFHGGASLAEAVVPILVAQLAAASPQAAHSVTVELTYKIGQSKVRTRLPVIDVHLKTDDMFAVDQHVEILIEAQDSAGNVIGEPRPGGEINPTTRTLTLVPGERRQVALRMSQEYEGKFTVKALNPTTLTAYGSLKLETDYTV